MIEIKNHYQVIIVGGGIVGAGIFRDLSLHNIETLLVDKKNFAGQTSSRSSKMLHGGIRYLENLDFPLIKEALAEKNLWLKIAPDFAEEKMFLMPVYKDSLRTLPEIWAGVFLYDALSKFQNSPSKFCTKNNVLNRVPNIKRTGLQGGGIYADSIVDDKGLNKAIIADSLRLNKSQAIENCDVLDIIPENQGFKVLLKFQDTTTYVTTEDIVIATGPFTDKLLTKFKYLNWTNCLLPSKGSHIWIKKEHFNLEQSVVLTPNDGRVIFVIPHQERILVGTTEVPVTEDYFDVRPSQSELNYLLQNLNEYFPTNNFTERHIDQSFAGIRPLVKEDSNNQGKTSREHKIFNPFNNFHVIVGGKYTTFRVMGQNISRKIVLKNNKSYNCDLTKQKLINLSL